MPIKFNCPKCGQELNVKDEMAGKQGKCPKCKSTVTVPTPAAPRPAAAPPVRRKPVDEVEVVEEVEEAEVVEEDEPPRKRSPAVKKGKNDFDFSDEDEDTRVSSRRSSRRRDEEDEDEPRRKKKSRRDEEDEDEDEPRRGKRASAKRRRDDDEDDDYEDDEGGSSEKRKKARERQRRKAWKTATTGVFLNFISMCAYTGGCAVVLLAFLVVLLATLAKSEGFLSFAGILGYLAFGLFLVAWIVYIVGGGFLVVSPNKNGEKGLGITCVSVGAVLLGFTIYILVAADVSFRGLFAFGPGSGGLRTFSVVLIIWPLVEWARLSMLALFEWAASKTMKEGELVATSIMLAIVIPSAGFGSFIVIWLLGMVFSSSPSMALVYLMQFVVLLMVGGWAALMGWFTLHTSAVKNSMDHA